MYDFARQKTVDAFKRLRAASESGSEGSVRAARAEFKEAVAEEPKAGEVVGKTLDLVQRIDPFAVICAVVDQMFEILTSDELIPLREQAPGCGAFTGSFSKPEFLTVVDFRRHGGSIQPPELTADELKFAGLLFGGYQAEMWVLRAPDDVDRGLVFDELRKRAKSVWRGDEVTYDVWRVDTLTYDTVNVVYPDPDLEAARAAAAGDIAKLAALHFMVTPAQRRAAEEKPLFYIDDSSGVRALAKSMFRVRAQRHAAVSGRNDDWEGAFRMLFPDS
jgi:hypothetical protein